MKILGRHNKKDKRSPEKIFFDLSIEFKKYEKAFINNEEVSFTVKKILSKGVMIQIGSFSSYVHRFFFFNSILNDDIPYWKVVSPHLIGKTFKGKIAFLNRDNFYIKIDSENKPFESIPLDFNTLYKSIVVLGRRRKKFIFIDIGFHFNYRYGIHICFVHSSYVSDEEKFNQLESGDIYNVYFQGRSNTGEIFLSDSNHVFSLDSNEPKDFFYARKQATFLKSERDLENDSIINLFFELKEKDETIKIISPIIRKYYNRNVIKNLKSYFEDVERGSEFCCKIVGIDKRNRAYIGVVIPDWV